MSKHKAPQEDAELDLMPVMNLFSILIPFLLSVAVFQKLAIVEVNMPERSEVNMDTPPPAPDDQSLSLTVAVTDNFFEIWARGGSMPKVYAKEFISTVRTKLHARSPAKNTFAQTVKKQTSMTVKKFTCTR